MTRRDDLDSPELTRASQRPRQALVALLCISVPPLAWGGRASAVDTSRGSGPLSRLACAMDGTSGLELQGEARAVREGPGGERVLHIEGGFSGRIDLKTAVIEPREFDLLKVDVKAGAGAFLRLSLENYPEPGDLSHWYVLDSARGAFDWRTIWVDLRKPEEIKLAGRYKGMASEDASLRGLRLSGDGLFWFRRVRFARKAVDVDWDQSLAPYERGPHGGIAFEYPVTLTNCLARPLTARLALVPFRSKDAQATLSADRVPLAPGERKTVRARIALTAAATAGKPPLYCERFELRARAEELADSEVTILRSSDPIHLTVTIPAAEEELDFPLLPRRRDLPETVTGFGERARRSAGEVARAAPSGQLSDPTFRAVSPDDLDKALDGPLSIRKSRGLYSDASEGEWAEAAGRYVHGLTACAFLYDHTGDRQYLERGTALLLRAAELFGPRRRQWEEAPVSPISSGVFSLNALRLGWATGGMRSPYSYKRHGMFNDFDLLASRMPPETRKRIIEGFIVPAAVHMRNHCIGIGNQQDVVNYAIMYAGLAARNWPLVSFAYSSEHGVLSQIRQGFDADGLCREGHYQAATVRPILYAAELLYHVGVDIYDERLHTVVHSPKAVALGVRFRDGIVAFLDENRFKGRGFATREPGPAGGIHLASGTTLLSWNGLQVGMNWGEQIHRNAPDRCTLRFRPTSERHFLRHLGGGNNTHSSLGQSVVIIDETVQNPAPARVLSYDVDGPVQHVMAESDKHFPGTTITRTFALIDGHVLVVDRVRSGWPRTADWCLKYGGKGIAIPMGERPGSFTNKPSDTAHGVNYGANLFSKSYFCGRTDNTWTEGGGRLTVVGEPGTEVLTFRVAASYSASRKEKKSGVPVLMVRRRNVKKTDYVAFFSEDTRSVARVAVSREDGRPAEAVGVRLTLKDGRAFICVVNYEPEGKRVAAEGLTTALRFATSCEDAVK